MLHIFDPLHLHLLRQTSPLHPKTYHTSLDQPPPSSLSVTSDLQPSASLRTRITLHHWPTVKLQPDPERQSWPRRQSKASSLLSLIPMQNSYPAFKPQLASTLSQQLYLLQPDGITLYLRLLNNYRPTAQLWLLQSPSVRSTTDIPNVSVHLPTVIYNHLSPADAENPKPC